jgi:flagellar hook-basal body complex protein FliE
MSVPAFSAANAYMNAARAGLEAATKTTGPEKTNPAQEFGALVDQAINSVVDAGKKSENIAVAHTQGKADLVDVVTAVAETELTMRTLVSVRDRVVSAYQEIMRMPI